MVVDVVGLGTAGVLAGLAGWHVYWAAGGRVGTAAVVPTADGRALLTPSTVATLVVAGLLAVSAALLVGGVAGWEPRLLFRVGSGGIAAVLLARAVGDGRTIGVFKRRRGTPFARRDTWLYSPLCVLLAVAAAAVATRA